MLCLSPHIPGTSDDYTTHPVRVAVAFNGQDFMEDTSSAQVTFKGTGRTTSFIVYLITALLVALFIVALVVCLITLF